MTTDVKKFPGHLRAAMPIVDSMLTVLLDHYNGWQPFVDDCAAVKVEFEDRLIYANVNHFPREAIEDAEGALRQLARRWNLDRIPMMREFDFWQIRNAVLQTGRQFASSVGRPFSPFSVTFGAAMPEHPSVTDGDFRWEWQLVSSESLRQLRERIARDLDVARVQNLPSSVAQQLQALPSAATELGWTLVDVPHQGLKHVYWLFLRLIPLPRVPLGYTRIASWWDEDCKSCTRTDPRMVRRDVERVASQLGIDLRPGALGRPRGPRGGGAIKLPSFLG